MEYTLKLQKRQPFIESLQRKMVASREDKTPRSMNCVKIKAGKAWIELKKSELRNFVFMLHKVKHLQCERRF